MGAPPPRDELVRGASRAGGIRSGAVSWRRGGRGGGRGESTWQHARGRTPSGSRFGQSADRRGAVTEGISWPRPLSYRHLLRVIPRRAPRPHAVTLSRAPAPRRRHAARCRADGAAPQETPAARPARARSAPSDVGLLSSCALRGVVAATAQCSARPAGRALTGAGGFGVLCDDWTAAAGLFHRHDGEPAGGDAPTSAVAVSAAALLCERERERTLDSAARAASVRRARRPSHPLAWMRRRQGRLRHRCASGATGSFVACPEPLLLSGWPLHPPTRRRATPHCHARRRRSLCTLQRRGAPWATGCAGATRRRRPRLLFQRRHRRSPDPSPPSGGRCPKSRG
jgi:hypothetical protein